MTREQEKANTYAPAINKYSRKIAEAGSIKNVKAKRDQEKQQLAYTMQPPKANIVT